MTKDIRHTAMMNRLTISPLAFLEVTHFLTAKTFGLLCTACNIKTGYKRRVNEMYCSTFAESERWMAPNTEWVKVSDTNRWVIQTVNIAPLRLTLLRSLQTLFTRRALGPVLRKDNDELYVAMFDKATNVCSGPVSPNELQKVQDTVIQMLHLEKIDRMRCLLNVMDCKTVRIS